MDAHVSSILLGVRDMERSKRFYTEGLGWKVERDCGVSVFFVPHGGSMVGFYGRDGLAANVGVSPEGSGFSGLVLTYVVRSQARVDELMAEPGPPAPGSSSPPPPCSGAGTAVPSRTRTATSGTSATAPRARTSPMRSSRRQGELHGQRGRTGGDVVLHPVSDPAAATAVDVAVLGVAPHIDGASYVGLEAAGQHVGITNLLNRLNGTTRQAPAAETMIGRIPKGRMSDGNRPNAPIHARA